jgi:S1-C subfamily serine protease
VRWSTALLWVLASTASALTDDERSTIALFERASPAVVYITSLSVRRDFFTLNVLEIPQGTGTGFVWDQAGHVVTNFHVIQNADRAQVTLADRTTWSAVLVGVAPAKDLAVLRIDAPAAKLHALPVGSSGDLKVGQSVLAIGNPFGLDQTLTTGVISALGREIESVAQIPIRDVIQTDAAINPGNSGGPLLDSSGRLIGVNTAIYSPSGAYAGIGFSIPVDTVKWVVPELIEHGKLRRPTLGVELANPQVSERLGVEGALVIAVQPGSGADRAGILPTRRNRDGAIELGDVIVEVENAPVRSNNDLVLALERRAPGETVEVGVLRGGKTTYMRVALEAAQ